MLFDKKYDLIFGIGEACSCTQTLRAAHLQFYSYPFDWLFGSDILTRAKILANYFKDFINLEDLEDINKTNQAKKNPCEIYKNKRNGILFNHDFKVNKPLSETYNLVREKYKRRADRLIKQINSSNNVLITYIQTPNNETEVSDKELIEVYEMLKNGFIEQNITFVYLYCNREQRNIEPIYLTENIIKFAFDYDGYNKDLPYVVNEKILEKIFCKIKITYKFTNLKNSIKRYLYLFRCKLRGMLH